MRDLMQRLQQSLEPAARSDLRQAISHDLEALLNTRSEASRIISAGYPECRKSSLTYGIPDFSTLSLHSPHDRERIRRILEQAIALHETRLSRVRVSLDPLDQQHHTLRFQVEALLAFGKERQRVQFDAELQLHTQTYRVEC
ncbi:type VI secretion system baseplate subunit TssE [Azotobacter chroococcum]|uniref:type VI secretion system baseplate subunit TssE n=1 Tax=Azotobacter chroococcum TaxID=353 RepID=UPI0010AE76FA|nr:type VI secretion system baseplate subunit TssE [Azotobacter chroococcum]TKD29912.1 type VI secretion system baseplate subunit TssE [Azotobacter chroococcum]